LLAFAAFGLLLPTAAAYDEQDAGLLPPHYVLSARHEPTLVPAHSQWHGVLVLRPGHPVVAAQYQVCRVGNACFAPPAPAQRSGADTFRFDTANYTAGGHAIDYQAGWRIGVQWLLTEKTANATRVVAFPLGPEAGDPACAGDGAALACQERHYLAFDMEPAPRAVPALGAPALLGVALLAGLAGVARRESRRHG
jgi:hypothetical protein